MRTLLSLTLAATTLCFASPASAKAIDGRAARSAVKEAYAKKGRSTNIRVHAVKESRSGKSVQLLVETKASGTVRALNYRKSNRTVYETPTGLVSQAEARAQANLMLRRDRGVRSNKKQPGTFSGVNSSGLSRSGNSYVLESATDRATVGWPDEVMVSAKAGRARMTRGDRYQYIKSINKVAEVKFGWRWKR